MKFVKSQTFKNQNHLFKTFKIFIYYSLKSCLLKKLLQPFTNRKTRKLNNNNNNNKYIESKRHNNS